jgi:predicted nucleic acid-binding protein
VTVVVIDASVAVASIIKEERTPELLALRGRIAAGGALVPGLWWLEVANVLLLAERKGRLARADRLDALDVWAAFPISTDPETAPRAWSDTLALAEAHRLTVYDAAYLELALRAGRPLATLDRELRDAAAARGVPLA